MADPVYRPVIFAAKSAFRLLGVRFDIVGQEHMPASGGAILAINHNSFLDYAFAGLPADRAGRRMVRFLAKEGIFRHPIAGPPMRAMGHISVDRDAGSEAFRQGVRALRDGELLGVFPEGTMSRSFELLPFKSGAVRMAAMAQVPIIPMIVFGGQRVLSYGHRDLSRGKPVAMTIGAPIQVEKRGDAHAQTEQLRQVMGEMLDATIARYPRPSSGDLWWLPKRLGGTAPTPEEVKRMRGKQRDSSEEESG
ncbi:MAG: lysophospholipid acyltransferase family protein [Candidatus Nanopelagicales bacterium]